MSILDYNKEKMKTLSSHFCAKEYVYYGLHIEKKYQSVTTLYQAFQMATVHGTAQKCNGRRYPGYPPTFFYEK